MNEKLLSIRIKKGWSQGEAAEAVGVATRTYQRWEHGSSMPNFESRRMLRQAFGAADRELGIELGDRENEKQSLDIFQLSSHLTRSILDLDLLESYADALHTLLIKGETLYVMYASQNWYQRLKQFFSLSEDASSAHVVFRFGMLVGAAQECILPWYQRSYEIVQTYNDIENNVICKYSLDKQLNQEYVQLIAKRGRQYRVLWKFEESKKACEEGVLRLKDLNDLSLQIHFLCERSHIEATKGDEISWMYKLDNARKYALDMQSEDREKALNQINYMQGEGYKRFAFHTRKDVSISAREKFARRAIEQFHGWSGTSIELPGFESLVVQVSKAQCLILLDPDEAIYEAGRLEKLVGQLYPTLLDKLHRVNFLAQQRLQMSNDEFLQAFSQKPLVVYGEGGNIL
jgi:transcriptional regulator with XRE-family HTH domain